MQSGRPYHVSRNGKLVGRFDEGAMRELLRLRKLLPTDDYWTPGMKAWAKLAILPPSNRPSKPAAPAARPSVTAPRQQPPAPMRSHLRTKWLALGSVLAVALIAWWVASSGSASGSSGRDHAEPALTPAKPIERKRVELVRGFAPFHPSGNEIFPSLTIAYANSGIQLRNRASDEAPHYGDIGFVAGVLVDEPRRGDRITLEISPDRFMRPSTLNFTVTEDARSATMGPAPLFDFEALAKVRQTTPFNVTIKVRKNDEEPVVFNEVWQAHQINDCPIGLSLQRLTNEKMVIGSGCFSGRALAGYVNENHPMIDQILAEAKATGICRAFTGYGEDDAGIIRQIQAIWVALQKRDISYSNTAESTLSPLHSFQHVRMLDQCLQSRQANCLDATVMLASVLRKIGINTGIILVPDHAYLVVYDKSGSKREFAIESTGLTGMTLNEAIKAATEEGKDNLRKVESRLDGREEGHYREIPVEACRRAGIQPIPYAP